MTRREILQLALSSLPLAAQDTAAVAALSQAAAQPVLDEFSGELPADLEGTPWADWEVGHDREIRARLQRGDADSIVNLVLFGTSFTTLPRCTGTDAEEARRLILGRVQDFARAVAHPGNSERLQFASGWLKQQPGRVEAVLLENAVRVMREQREYARSIAAAKNKGDAMSVLVERSSLYRERGLSLDTSFRPNYAIERSLAEIQAQGLLRRVERAAVVGPGLDFMDKRSGYDFYPVQTLQPFALIDSLRRLRLAETSGPDTGILDLSERALGHIRRSADADYTVQIPLDGETKWLQATVEYWKRSCLTIGSETRPAFAPPGTPVRMRAVRIRRDVVKLLQPLDVDIVIQHAVLSEARKFDLMVATNILVYYSQFEQGLAMANIAAMLRPGGILLSNNVLPEVSGVPMKAAGATSVAYSEDADDGDHVLWYRRT